MTAAPFPIALRATKVVLYVTHRNRALVFLDPDYPHIALQVLGGTVEDGDNVELAARRELIL